MGHGRGQGSSKRPGINTWGVGGCGRDLERTEAQDQAIYVD